MATSLCLMGTHDDDHPTPLARWYNSRSTGRVIVDDDGFPDRFAHGHGLRCSILPTT